MSRFAAFAAQMASGPLPVLFGLSVAAYAGLAILPDTMALATICGDLGVGGLVRLLQSPPVPWSPSVIAADWGLMVVAMMTPLTALPVAHVYRSSLPGRRTLAAAAFLAAFWAVWVVAAVPLVPLSIALTSVAGPRADVAMAILISLAYGASPGAQRARNRCHRMGRIAAFGPGALAGSARQGLVTGLNCAAVCWPLMLVPMTVETWHLTAMVLAAAYVFADRIAPAAPPEWRLPPAVETLLGPRHSRVLKLADRTNRA